MSDGIGALARVLRCLRAEQQVDQLRLALAMGSSDASYLSKLENGRSRNPSVQMLGRIVTAYADLGRPLSAAQSERLLVAALNMLAPDAGGSPA